MKKRLVSLALAALMTLSLMACGNTAAKPTPTPQDTTPTPTTVAPDPVDDGTQGVTDTEILIGNTCSVSGALASTGIPMVAGLEAYLEMVNESGGIGGRKITYVHRDDDFDPIKGKAYLQELVEDVKVFAIVMDFGTPVVAATVDDLKSYGIPTVYFATGIGQLYAEGATTNADGVNLFPVQPIYITEGQLMTARCVANLSAQKIGVIYTNDDAGKDMLNGAQMKAQELGVELVSQQVVAGTADASSAVTAIKSEGVDAVIVAAIQATMPTIVKEMVAQGMDVPAITSYVNCSMAMTDLIYESISGKFDVYANGWLDYTTEVNQEAYNLYLEWIPEEYALNAYAQCGWIAGATFCEGLRRLEDSGEEVTWTNYIAAMEEAPVAIPFGAVIDYAGGMRTGTQSMNLFRCDKNDPSGIGWAQMYPLESIDEILAGVK